MLEAVRSLSQQPTDELDLRQQDCKERCSQWCSQLNLPVLVSMNIECVERNQIEEVL